MQTSLGYPQSYGRLERWYGTIKSECIRPGLPLSPEEARRLFIALHGWGWVVCFFGFGHTEGIGKHWAGDGFGSTEGQVLTKWTHERLGF